MFLMTLHNWVKRISSNHTWPGFYLIFLILVEYLHLELHSHMLLPWGIIDGVFCEHPRLV